MRKQYNHWHDDAWAVDQLVELSASSPVDDLPLASHHRRRPAHDPCRGRSE
jgi:hypothetical protein